MIYRYTEKIQKAQDDWRTSRLNPFLDVQRADGAQSLRDQTAESSTKCPIGSNIPLGNTLIHLIFIEHNIEIHICCDIFKHVEEIHRFSS